MTLLLKFTKTCFIVSILLEISCAQNPTDKFDKMNLTGNKFTDSVMLDICKLQSERKTEQLMGYFNHSNPAYRESAALAFASVQDIVANESLLSLLRNDPSIKVKKAAAFALGQMNDSTLEEDLILISQKTESPQINNIISEAIGKCGTKKGHDYLVDCLSDKSKVSFLNGLLTGLYRFSMHGICSEKAIRKIVDILSDERQSDETIYIASLYLVRVKGLDLKMYSGNLIRIFNKCNDEFTRMNIVSALSKSVNNETLSFLISILVSDFDYRIKINAIKSLYAFNYSDVSKTISQRLNDKNSNIAVQASEFFLVKGTQQDASWYLSQSQRIKNWRVRTNLLSAAIKYSVQKGEISASIIEHYKNSKLVYEKAGLIKSLGADLRNFNFVKDELKFSKEIPVTTAAIEALTEMRRLKDFDTFCEENKKSGKGVLRNEFALVFKNAILSGDVARVGIAAEILRDENLDFRSIYKDNSFLYHALKKCQLPAETEIYRELQKTIAFFNGAEYVEQTLPIELKTDWSSLSQISFNQIVKMKTSKGDIELQLFVNEAPISVANFLKLVSEGYYNNKLIHRLVPNFVVQDGCPRGDGWGGPDYTICSEFAQNYYKEGSVGMASAGKDTESSQWFITHSPTPHLDGRYTNFGSVIKGMDVVHNLEMGDTIYSMEIIK